MNKVTVRLVPHGSAAISLSDFATTPTDRLAGSINPSRRSMQRAARGIENRALRAEESALWRLSVDLDERSLREMFGDIDLEEQASETDAGPSTTLSKSYQSPSRALPIPDALKDSVAFAYVPRPVEFFSPLSIPPIENIYHLRIADVQIALNAPRAHRNGWTGAGVKVAMADSGFMLHPWFIRSGARLIPTESPGSGPADIDLSGHGTGEAANIFAIAPDCTVYGVKHGSSAAATLETCIAQNPDIMTNSWGFDIDHQSRSELQTHNTNMFFELLDIEAVIASAVSKGITIMFSAGNGHHAFPASHPDVIAIGGVTVNEDGSLEASNYASAFESQLYPGQSIPDFCGVVGRSEPSPQSGHIMLPVPPTSDLDGENSPSGTQGTGWGIFSGTSAACPQAAGAAALLKQISKSLTPAQIRQVLAARAVNIDKGKTATGATASPGKDLATGTGLIDALRACGFVAGVA